MSPFCSSLRPCLDVRFVAETLTVRAEEQLSGTPTTPFHVDAVSSSEAASLHGQKAKTPIIAGSICGAVLGLAWIIGLFIYIRKRYRRKMRKRAALAAGQDPEQTVTKHKSKSAEPAEKVIIPPDPAVLLGHGRPGEHIYPESKGRPPHNRTSSEAAVSPPSTVYPPTSSVPQKDSMKQGDSSLHNAIPLNSSSTSNR
ncbi:hypothetical protein VNI00_011743 [Paramarasmius palmivorus]|uniref:Uncharacterized protein n=1 Tax=Paramarasmius palmivorus TaxID=297713 RepID=A0AAW0C7K1_9AGAR